MKQRGADGNAAFGKAHARLLDGDVEHVLMIQWHERPPRSCTLYYSGATAA
jgi:hypothetical protein